MTLKDVADKAGVSMMTVSNVINGKTKRVSQKTMDRVNAIIEECGYVPNQNARSLSNKTSHIIALIIFGEEDIRQDENYFENPYLSTMVGIIERELQKKDYFMMVRSVSRNADIISLLKNWSLDGIIIIYPATKEYMVKLMDAATCPIATFDCELEHPNLINITSNDEEGLYLSTKYMINHGHTEIAFVADYRESHILRDRFNGYKRALEESGLPLRPEYVFRYPPSYEGGLEAGRQIAKSRLPITAAVTTADICAVGIMEGARLSGYRIPIDLSVIGYDNLSLCQYTTPKLTSVSQNVTQKAQSAARLLIEKIQMDSEEAACPQPPMDVAIVDRQSVISLR